MVRKGDATVEAEVGVTGPWAEEGGQPLEARRNKVTSVSRKKAA